MANSSVCASCLRALRTAQSATPQQRLLPRLALQPARSFTTTLRTYQTPDTQPSKPTSKPPPPKPLPSQAGAGSPSRDALSTFAASLRSSNSSTLRAATEPLVAYGVTEDLYALCAQQCTYAIPSVLATPPSPAPKNAGGEDVGESADWWFAENGLGLDVTFNSWAQVQFLHLYALSMRFRRFPKEHVGIWQQHLLDHFFYAAEDRMAVYHGMSARGVRNKHLKDLWLQWRGVLLSYDEGVIRGDAVLAGAVWRNLFKGAEDVPLGKVLAVVGYLRRQMRMLDLLDDGTVASGKVEFGDAREVMASLGLGSRESPWLTRPFSAEDVKPLVEEAENAQKTK